MCGRFLISQVPEAYRAFFGYDERPNFPARYNVAPTQPVPVVFSEQGTRHFRLVRWGFWPGWLKDPADFPLVINARAETLLEKPSFRGAARHRRCVFLADGFYEWRREGEGRKAKKTPFMISMADGSPMALAGIWETWSSADGSEVDTAAIVTCGANGTLAAIHHRMPVILSREALGPWLDSRDLDEDGITSCCRPFPDEWLSMVEIGDRVNNVRNDDAGLIEPVRRAIRKPARPKPEEPSDADSEQGRLL